jgi:hypothetical protein
VAVSLRTLNVEPGGRAEHGDSADIVEAKRTGAQGTRRANKTHALAKRRWIVERRSNVEAR